MAKVITLVLVLRHSIETRSIITSSIMRHASDHGILYPLQHGFRTGRSCDTQLSGFINDLVSAVHDGHQIDALLMDFSKAFDKVSHGLLIRKLKHSGV